jgi:glucuronate isomerase
MRALRSKSRQEKGTSGNAEVSFSLHEHYQAYIDFLSARKSPSTVRAYLSDISQLNEYSSGEFKFETDFLRLFLRKFGGSPTTRARKLSTLRGLAKFLKSRGVIELDATEALEAYRGFLMVYFGELDAKRGWVKQLHFGALRNANTRGFREVGPDTGFDSIGDWPQIEKLAAYLDELESRGKLPKTVLYNLNPADNYAVAALCGNFQGGGIRGKIQFGSGWWFLDQLDGMRWQLNALSQLGILANFVGMLTDSRSFLSYPRHEYFRRLLCQILGEEVERGMLPKDMKLLEGMVRDICYRNAEAYFRMEAGKA